MKRYEVLILPQALSDLRALHEFIAKRAPETADRWFNGFIELLMSLETNPERCGKAPEDKFFPAEVRQIFYGKRRDRRYRVLFAVAIDDVRVLHVRGPRQRLLRPRDMGLG